MKEWSHKIEMGMRAEGEAVEKVSRTEIVRCKTDTLTATKRLMWNVLGTTALVFGVIGLFLPLLPTTPLVLASAACYLRGSKRMHQALVSNRLFGQILSDYESGRGISWRVRLVSTAFLWTSLGVSFLYFHLPPFILPILVLVGMAVSTHIYHLPLKRS